MKTLFELAQLVGGKISGDENTLISGIGSIFQGVAPDCIVFIENASLLQIAEETKASAIIAPYGTVNLIRPLLLCRNPKEAFARIAALFVQNHLQSFEISPLAFIHPKACIQADVSVHPFAVISENVVIGNGSIIGSGVFIGKNTSIGSNCIIHANTVIEDSNIIGSNVIIHSCSVIGADGFGFIKSEDSLLKVPQLGNVIIEDNVEIFANVTVDRGTAGSTIIGSGTKLGDFVHIGHNAVIGKHCIFVAQSVVGGSTKIGDWVTCAGKSGITDHVTIGNNVTISACTIVHKNIESGRFLSGDPAMEHKKDYRIKASVRKLPELIKKVRQLEKKIEELESKE